MAQQKKSTLSPLENQVMQILWDRTLGTAEDVRLALATSSSSRSSLKDSTVRTLLRRLEQKGYVTHIVDGRTYVYSPQIESRSVAADAVRSIIDRFCDGSVENLLVGMVDDALISAETLKRLADRIARAETAAKKKSN
jgi:predicted transcriptional regulator